MTEVLESYRCENPNRSGAGPPWRDRAPTKSPAQRAGLVFISYKQESIFPVSLIGIIRIRPLVLAIATLRRAGVPLILILLLLLFR